MCIYDSIPYHKGTCEDYFDCCDCGGNDCGCAYCWSCNACEDCLGEDEENLPAG
jgi:hypothetical protein